MIERHSDIAIIGGSGVYKLSNTVVDSLDISTPYDASPIRLYLEELSGRPVWFLPRHGKGHSLPPHNIPYRAQMWALKECGVKQIIALNAVGGISADNMAGRLVVPDQIIDYSWGREHTYFDGLSGLNDHIDFTDPYTETLRRQLIEACEVLQIAVSSKGTYACTQGPRLETRAEVRKLALDGCDIVGMTGMPEAALARELGLEYACLALVVNRAAGLGGDTITSTEIQRNLEQGVKQIKAVLHQLLQRQK